MRKHFIYISLIFSLILGSCAQSNFQKQKFTNLKKLESYHRDEEKKVVLSNKETQLENETAYLENNFEDDLIFDKTVSEQIEEVLDEDCGDRITFKSGAFVLGKVIQVSKNSIVYRRCDNLEGPAYTVIKEDLAEVRYANGTIEELTNSNQNTPEIKGPKKESKVDYSELDDSIKPIEPLALVSFILSFTYLFWIPGIILGIISLGIQKKKAEQYRKNSRFFATFGIIFPLVVVIIALIIFMIFLFLL